MKALFMMPKTILIFTFFLPLFSNANNYYVSPSGNDLNDGLTPATAVFTIGQGVSLCVNGDVVNIAAGNYMEQVAINNKSIELKGAGIANTIIQCPSSLPQSFMRGTGEQHPIIMVTNTTNATIDNLTVDGLLMGATVTGSSLVYNFDGIGTNNSGGNIYNVEVKNISDNPPSGAQRGTGIILYASSGTAQTFNITNCNIHDNQKTALLLDGANLTTTISNNAITGYGPISYIVQNGIQVSNGALVTIRINTISNFNYIPTTSFAIAINFTGGANGSFINANKISNSNIGIYDDGSNTISQNTITNPSGGYGIYIITTVVKTITATNNFFTAGNYGVYIDAATANVNVGLHNNSFTNHNTYAIANYSNSAAAVDASCNWYGTAMGGTIPSKIYGNVNFIPYLNNGTDSDPSTAGFQPANGSCVTPVPLKLLEFTATKNNNMVLLKWLTTNEVNVQGFIIERSFNSTSNTENIGFIKATGNLAFQTAYTFIDSNATKNGVYYYTLKMIDNDGTYTLSQIKIIAANNYPTINYTIFPNPVVKNSAFTITYLGTGNTTAYRLYDTNSKLLQSGNFNQNLTLTIPISGFYFVELVTNGIKDVKKIIVK